MTEADVAALDAAALSTPLDPRAESNWARQALTEYRQLEQHRMAEYKLQRFLRRDIEMRQLADELVRLRASIEYLNRVLGHSPVVSSPPA